MGEDNGDDTMGEETVVDDIGARLDTLEARILALENRPAAVALPPEIGVLVDAIRETQEEDIAPRSSSWLYRPIGRARD